MISAKPAVKWQAELLFLAQVVFTWLTPTEFVFASILDHGEPYFENFSSYPSPSMINAIATDKNGFLWFGSVNGISRFDGYRFRTYAYEENKSGALSGDFIKCLWAAEDGKLWAGTQSNGVSVLDPHTELFTTFKHDPKQINSLSDNRIKTIIGDQSGKLWIGTNNGLNLYDPIKKTFTHYKHNSQSKNSINSNKIRTLYIDNAGNLWVGTSRGLNLFNPKKNNFINVKFHINNNLIIDNHEILSFFQSRNGRYWFSTTQYDIAWFEHPNNELHILKLNDSNSSSLIRSIMQLPKENEIWLASDGEGIYTIDSERNEVISNIRHNVTVSSSLRSDNIYTLHLDPAGLVWVGTWGSGIQRYNPQNKAFKMIHYNPKMSGLLNEADIHEVKILSNKDIWIGSRNSGISILHHNSNKITKIQNQSTTKSPDTIYDNSIRAIEEDADNSVWIGTMKGLDRYQPETHTFTHYGIKDGLLNPHIRDLYPSHDGGMWIGTQSGLNKWDKNTGKIRQFTVAKDKHISTFVRTVTSLIELPDKSLWVGTYNGIYVLPYKSTKLSSIIHDPENSDSLSHNTIAGFNLLKDGSLLVSTETSLDRLVSWDGTIAKFNSISKAIGGTKKDHWGNTQEDDAGRIWSEDFMIDKDKKVLTRLNKANGLELGIMWWGAYDKTTEGELLYGNSRGLLIIKPEYYEEWDYEPPLVISDLSVNGEAQPSGDIKNLVLPANTRSYSIEFSALDYSAPEKNQYEYQLKGYDPEWVQADSDIRRATYTNLEPGHYTFMVRGTNRQGQWSRHKITLPIHQLPAWHQTIWFKLLIVIGCAIVIWLGIQFRLRKLSIQKIKLEQEVLERTKKIEIQHKQLIAQEKMASIGTLAAGVAHEINNPTNFTNASVYMMQDEILEIKDFLHDLAGGDNAEAGVLNAIDERFSNLLKLVNTAKKGTERIHAIVNNLLSITGFDETKLVKAKISPIIKSTLDLVKTKYHKIDFTIDILHDPTVHCCEGKMSQVIMNLIVNACQAIETKYDKGEGGEISVLTEIRGEHLSIVIKDNGCGMDEGVIKRMFDPFFTTKEVGTGTGLGMAITYGIIQEHAGHIEVYSVPNEGAQITIYIPTNNTIGEKTNSDPEGVG